MTASNNSSLGFINNKYFPGILCLFLLILHFLSGYPGGMSKDTFSHFQQSLSLNLNSHHPPVMAILWHCFHYIHPGPQTMLFFHLSLLWGGVMFLYYADETNKFRWLYFVIPFLPNILSQSTIIWKDVGFTFSFFFVISVCIFYLYKNKKANLAVIASLILITFYGSSVKFQAKFIVPILVFFIVSISTNKSFILKFIISCIVSFILIFINSWIINKYTINGRGEQIRQFFDISAIIIEIDNDDALPDYIKNYKGYNFEKLKKEFSSISVTALFYTKDICPHTLDNDKLKELNNTFYSLIAEHPLIYIKHRLINSSAILQTSYWADEYGTLQNEKLANDLNIYDYKKNFIKKAVIKFLKYYPRNLSRNSIAIILIFIYLLVMVIRYSFKVKESIILAYIIVISLSYSVTLMCTAMANDYRYYYIVRMLSFFAIPIFLKSIFLNNISKEKLKIRE